MKPRRLHPVQRRRGGRRGGVRRVRRAARRRRSELHVRRPHDRAAPRRARAESRGAAGRRRQPRVRVAADAPALHRRAHDSQSAADALVSGQQRPGNLRRRIDPRRWDRARRHRVGRRVRQALQQAAATCSIRRRIAGSGGRASRGRRRAPPTARSSRTRISPARDPHAAAECETRDRGAVHSLVFGPASS